MSIRILIGDCRDVLRRLPDASVQCCVTSPPYFGLRDYGVASQIGLEPTPDAFVAEMVAVFREVRRVLRDDGTLWLNLGDSYAGSGKTGGGAQGARTGADGAGAGSPNGKGSWWSPRGTGLKVKDLIGIPWMVAKALQAPFYTGRIKRIEDRIWLAAMIDGEGCMFIHRRKAGQGNHSAYTKKDGTVSRYSRTQDTYGAGLEVANTSLAIVERCMQIAGMGSICRQDKDRRQPLYRWNLRSNECRDLVAEVYPHLVGKQQQARLLIGCPSSGPKAEAAHAAMIDLHNGKPSDVDFPPPASLYEPGWYLRSDIIWSKLNPMPESVTDRPTSAHEHVFLFSKSERYHYDAEAIKEPAVAADLGSFDGGAQRNRDGSNANSGRNYRGGKQAATAAASNASTARRMGGSIERWDKAEAEGGPALKRNARNVWTIATRPFPEAHFATFPPELAERCILAGCPAGGTVLDPFGGAGTTGLVADRLQRDAVLIELNHKYAAMAERRIAQEAGLFADVAKDTAA